jgi:hypothetical protein
MEFSRVICLFIYLSIMIQIKEKQCFRFYELKHEFQITLKCLQ